MRFCLREGENYFGWFYSNNVYVSLMVNIVHCKGSEFRTSIVCGIGSDISIETEYLAELKTIEFDQDGSEAFLFSPEIQLNLNIHMGTITASNK